MARLRSARSLVIAALVAVSGFTGLVGFSPGVAHAAGGGPLGLSVTPDQSVYVSGQPVTLTLQLTNNATSPCEVTDLVDGSLVVDSYTRNGVTVAAPSSLILYDDSLSSLILSGLTTLAPTQSTALIWASTTNELTGGQALEDVVFAGDAVPPVGFLDTATPGSYVVQAHYQLPSAITLLPSDACTVASNEATASFAVTSGATAAAATDGIAIDPLANAAFKTDYANCLKKFQAPGGDPMGIIPVLSASTFTTTVSASVGGNSEVATVPNDGKSPRDGGTGKGSNTKVSWNNTNVKTFDDGVKRDPCAELYHELFHAYEDIKGISDERVFPGTTIPTVEVNATRAENLYRAAQMLPLRTEYTTTVRAEKLPAASGTTAATCMVTGMIAGPPKQLQITVQDKDADGLDNIVVASITNGTVAFPAVTRGTMNPVVVTITKTDQTKPTTGTLYITDVDGNLTRCDPEAVTITRSAGRPDALHLTGVGATDHLAHIANGAGATGLRDLLLTVDGHPYSVVLAPGQTRVVDIGPALRAGTANTVSFLPIGRPGSSAYIVLADS